MKKTNVLSLVLITAITLLLTACGSSNTKVVSSWTSDSTPRGSLSNVLVLAMLGDREAKDQIERNLVQDLSRNGANASTATDVFGPKGFEGISERAIARKLKNSGFTSVLIVTLRAKDKELNYNPGSVYVSPYGGRYGGYYGRYRYAYDNFYTPGYYTTSTEYLMDADIYSLATNQLIYSAQARSYDPGSRQSLAEGFSESIVNELKTKGFFYTGY